MLSYTIGPTLGNARAGAAARALGVAGSIIWGGVACVAGVVALAAALPKFLRYDGRDGLVRKVAEDAAWAAAAEEREAARMPGQWAPNGQLTSVDVEEGSNSPRG
jgi:hypothetical protein